jgi:predicted nucleotidyltransferase
MSDSPRGYAHVSHPVLQKLFRSPLTALAAHWLFQGILYMDPTERRFKLAVDAFLTVLAAVPLGLWLRWDLAWLAAFLLAHTLNFLANGHLWGVLKHYGAVSLRRPEFDAYLHRLAGRISAGPGIHWAGIYGSLVRGQWSPTSDLDVRLIRKPGTANALRACLFVLIERSRALLHRFPLDIYLLDGPGRLASLRHDEPPLIIRPAPTPPVPARHARRTRTRPPP